MNRGERRAQWLSRIRRQGALDLLIAARRESAKLDRPLSDAETGGWA